MKWVSRFYALFTLGNSTSMQHCFFSNIDSIYDLSFVQNQYEFMPT